MPTVPETPFFAHQVTCPFQKSSYIVVGQIVGFIHGSFP